MSKFCISTSDLQVGNCARSASHHHNCSPVVDYEKA